MENIMAPDDILNFWFNEIKQSQWWTKDLAFDQEVRERFGHVHTAAQQCELYLWRNTARGRLAEVIILDQFSRNMFRDSAGSFASDPQALSLAQEAVAIGADKQLTDMERSFLYMPYMHSESLLVHEEAVRLFTQNGIDSNLEFELKHKVIIEKFGRYPHRNSLLGRASTEEEIEFLKQPGSSF